MVSGAGRPPPPPPPGRWDALAHSNPSNPVVFLEFSIAGQPVGRVFFELFADRVYAAPPPTRVVPRVFDARCSRVGWLWVGYSHALLVSAF